MVSFDVTSLFTNIPLKETIEIVCDLIFDNNPNIKITKAELKKLFNFATSETHFLFKGEYYDQIDGVAMGSPLAPVLANLFMSFHENDWFKNYKGNSPKFYKRYVDDIFAIFEIEKDSDNFLQYLNTRHTNIKFTTEKQNNNRLSFLDVQIDTNNNKLCTSVFRKSTFTGLLTRFDSFTDYFYKTGLVRCLIDRAYKINNCWKKLDLDIDNIKQILNSNSFPLHVTDKIIKQQLEKLYSKTSCTDKQKEDSSYFKLPFLGKQSDTLKKKIKRLSENYCKTSNVRIIFSPLKIKTFFSAKDSIPLNLKSFIIYKFVCAGCNSCYIGETTRHFATRINEHLRKDMSSHIYKHLSENENCFDNSTKDCFSILDTASTQFQLKLKEGM